MDDSNLPPNPDAIVVLSAIFKYYSLQVHGQKSNWAPSWDIYGPIWVILLLFPA